MDSTERTIQKAGYRLDPTASDPLYKQLRREIVKSLTRGEWNPGDKLPSESELARRYQVGISTVRSAIGEFVATKVLTRRQGKGTFVSLHNEQRYNYQFFHIVRNDGAKELPRSEIVSVRRATADEEICDLLRLPRRARLHGIFRIQQILRVSEIPIVVSDIVIPEALFQGMTGKAIRSSGEALYAIYQRHFGVNIIRTWTELSGVIANARAARTFGLPKNAPLLQSRRVAFTFDDLPVEVRFSQIDTRNYHFRLVEGHGT